MIMDPLVSSCSCFSVPQVPLLYLSILISPFTPKPTLFGCHSPPFHPNWFGKSHFWPPHWWIQWSSFAALTLHDMWNGLTFWNLVSLFSSGSLLFFPWQLFHSLYIASSSFNYPLGGHSISFSTNIWDLVESVRVTEIKEWGWELAGTACLILFCHCMGLERARATSAPQFPSKHNVYHRLLRDF